MTRPVIFLDFDGVLNSLGTLIGLGNPNRCFCRTAVGLVEKLAEETDAKVVVSSSWRLGRTILELKDVLREIGGSYKLSKRVWDRTPTVGAPRTSFDDRPHCRGDEIAEWLRINPHPVWVIIDDDSDMLDDQRDNFVQTRFVHGFTAVEYTKALKILQADHPDLSDLGKAIKL